MPMRWLIVVMLVLVSACSPPGTPSTRYAHEDVGYDVTRDSEVSGRYLASGIYTEGSGVKPEEVKARALLNGVEKARKDGYDLVVWTGPQGGKITQTRDYLVRTGPYQSRGSYLGFTYVVRGYKSNGDHPPNARPVGAVIDQINGELARHTL